MERILITGGSGFIARNLEEGFKGDYEVVSATRRDLDLMNYGEILDYIEMGKFDVVIHTATYDAAPKHSIKDPTKVMENNLRMFFNVARCRDYFGKMIYYGSGAEFGRENWKPRMSEEYFDNYVPADQYGFSKYVMTKFTLASEKIYNLRLFGMYGKYDDWRTRVIPNVCYMAISGKTVVIEQNRFYDFLHIDDLVRITKWFVDNEPKNKVYNVCSGKVVDFKTLAEKIVKISGKKLPVVINKKGLGTEYSGDNSLLMTEMKDFMFTSIDDGLRMLYKWYDKNKEDVFKENL